MKKQSIVIFALFLVLFTVIGVNALSIRMHISSNNVFDSEKVIIGGTLSKIKGEITEITVKVNAKKNKIAITPDANGEFSVEITLKKGANKVTFTAKDDAEEKSTREYTINRDDSLAITLFNNTLHGAHDLAFDGKGNVYVSTANSKSQRQGGSVYKIDTAGTVTEVLKPYTQTKEGDKMVYTDMFRGIEIAKDGSIYVLNETQSAVLKIDGKGGKELINGEKIFGANGLVIDKSGNLLITSTSKNIIYKLNPKTKALSILVENDPNLVDPTDIVIFKGNLYVTCKSKNNVIKIPEGGGSATVFADLGRTSYPYGLTVDSKGNLYVCQTMKRTILKIDQNGKIIVLAKRANWTDGTMWKDPVGIEFGDNKFGKESIFVCFKTNLPDLAQIYKITVGATGVK